MNLLGPIFTVLVFVAFCWLAKSDWLLKIPH